MGIRRLASICALLLIGCETTPPANPKIIRSDDHANVSVVRDEGMMAVGCTVDLLVDNVRVVGLRAGERADLRLTDGEHLLSIENKAKFSCAQIVDSVKVVAVPDKIQHFRIYFPGEGPARLMAQ